MPFFARHAPFVVAALCVLSPARAQSPSRTEAGAAKQAAVVTVSLRADTARAVLLGLPGAIAVEASADPAKQDAARIAAVKKASYSEASRARIARKLRAIGALGPRTPLRQPRIIAYTRNGVLPARSFTPASFLSTKSITAAIVTKSTSAKPTTPDIAPRPAPRPKPPTAATALRFKFTGFTATQLSDFNAFVANAYPLMTALYGDPAPAQRGRTVEVRNDSTAGDGLYELPATGQTTSGGLIRYDPILPDTALSAQDALRINEYNLLRQMLISFHGAQVLKYDAWELGMSDAAALIVTYQLHSSASFDPSLLGVYLLPIYDILNTPELGNPYFFTPGASPNLAFFRAGMAQAAWLKVYVENHDVFRGFNAAYYSGFNWNGPLFNGDITKHKAMVASFVPTVEGLLFNDWYARQQVLDISIKQGDKLWVVVVPQPNLTSGDTRSVFLGIAQRFTTAANGDETPVGGTGAARAFDETGVDVTLLSDELRTDNRVIFNTLGEAEFNGQNVPTNETPVVGFVNTGAPDRARLRIVVTLGSLSREALFPYGVAGTVAAPSGYYGALTGSLKGNLSITGRTTAAAVTRGVFSDAGSYPSNTGNVTTFTFTPTDGTAAGTWKRNGMWSFSGTQSQSFAVILEGAAGALATTRTFSGSGANHWRLISLPLVPTKGDEADALGVPRAALTLARYRNDNLRARFSENGIPFDVTADRHFFYPHLDAHFGPGRGYWLKLDQPLATTVNGSEPVRNVDYSVPLTNGWNTIGVPFNNTYSLSSLKVACGGATAGYADAVSRGWIGAGMWRWKAEGGYARVDGDDVASQALAPYEGYYLWCGSANGVSLIFPPKPSTNAALPRAATSAQNWRLPLTVSSATARDDSSAFGVTTWTDGQPLTRAAAHAPGGPRSLTFSFFSSGDATTDAAGAGTASGWAECLGAPAASLSARALADGATAGQTVTVAWGSLAQLPVALDAFFIDEATGQGTDMAKGLVYRFVSDGKPRRFRIEATERKAGILAFAVRQLTGSRMVEASATFGVAGRATLDIEKPDGDLVRNIAVSEKVEAGARKWAWGGGDAAGHAVPAGSYTAHLHLVDDRGVETEKTVSFALK